MNGEQSSLQQGHRTFRFLLLAVCYLLSVSIAIALAALTRDSAFVDGQFVPVTNDSFYHARRILDTVFGTPGFYQFEERLHIPEGAWIPWPWAYDYLVAQLTKVVSTLFPAVGPERVLAFIPVAWLAINFALFLAAAIALRLGVGYIAALLLMLSISPLVQLPHGPGMIDHHYIELTFVLLYLWLGLRWSSELTSTGRAAALGIAVGAAPAFHNGLFILQIPLLAFVFAMWARGRQLSLRVVAAFAAAFVGTTMAMLIPSEPFRLFMFEFALHSWFHLYVAFCTVAVMFFMSRLACTRGSFLLLALVSLLLASPLLGEALRGVSFLGTDFSVLNQITEARSPFEMFFGKMGPMETASYYSWLIVVAPPLLALFAWQAFTRRDPRRLFFAVIGVFGLGLMLTQYRFHYFGLFVFLAGLLLVVQDIARNRQWRGSLVALGVLLTIAVAFQPPLKERLFTIYALGADPHYAQIRPLLALLKEKCDETPSAVLAGHDDGSYLLYHTDCSILANNFIMRPEDEEKIRQLYQVMRLPLNELRQSPLGFRYILLRAADFIVEQDGRPVLIATETSLSRLLVDGETVDGFKTLLTIREEGNLNVLARLIEITELGEPLDSVPAGDAGRH